MLILWTQIIGRSLNSSRVQMHLFENFFSYTPKYFQKDFALDLSVHSYCVAATTDIASIFKLCLKKGVIAMKYEYSKYRLELVREVVFSGCDYQIVRSSDIHKFATEICELHKRAEENFITIAINAKGKIIGYSVISTGDLSSSVTHPREIFKFAICCNAGSVIFIHNHPSEDSTPSDTDVETTKRLIKAGDILGIPVLDHIVIGNEHEYTSMRAQGLV